MRPKNQASESLATLISSQEELFGVSAQMIWQKGLCKKLSLPKDTRPDLPNSFSSVALILHPKKTSLENPTLYDSTGLLWIQRATNPKDPWSGHMAFPGGRQDPEDRDSLATAIRETREEIGLGLEKLNCLGHLRAIRARNRMGSKGFQVVPLVFWVDHLPEFILDTSEVAAVHSLSLKELTVRENRSKHRIQSPEGKWSFPCIHVADRMIWGLSFKMLDDLLRRLRELPEWK